MRIRRSSLALSVGLLTGCFGIGDGDEATVALEAHRHDSLDVAVLSLSHSLRDVSSGVVGVVEVRPDLTVGQGEDTWFGAIADVEGLGSGAFAVLDWMQGEVRLFDSQGASLGKISGPGDGPGDLKYPWAMTALSDWVVVRQDVPTAALKVFNQAGVLRSTVPAVPEGDWSRPAFRWPQLNIMGFQMGPEDVSRRLVPFGDSSFIHVLQANEFAEPDWHSPLEFEAIPTYLIRYDLDGQVRDTLAELAGPPTKVVRVEAGRTIFYTQPLFSGWPLIATGDGWYATGHGDSTEIVVRTFDGDSTLLIRIPPDRTAVTEEDRLQAATWSTTAQLYSSANSRQVAKEEPGLIGKEIENRATNTMQFADSIPRVAALHGSGRCLFVAGFNSTDWQDGTSLNWVVIDVTAGSLLTTIRLAPPVEPSFTHRRYSARGGAVRDFDGGFAFVFHRNQDGVSLVSRYPLSTTCGS